MLSIKSIICMTYPLPSALNTFPMRLRDELLRSTCLSILDLHTVSIIWNQHAYLNLLRRLLYMEFWHLLSPEISIGIGSLSQPLCNEKFHSAPPYPIWPICSLPFSPFCHQFRRITHCSFNKWKTGCTNHRHPPPLHPLSSPTFLYYSVHFSDSKYVYIIDGWEVT